MAWECKVTRKVEFSETDLAGIMHFSNFFRYMETAEHAFFRSLGLSIVTTQVTPPVGWPRVHAACDYKRPLKFEDDVEIRLLVREIREKTIRYAFEFRKLNAPAPELAARGELVVACVTKGPDGAMKAVPIPNEIAAKIEAAPETCFA
ncbi:MAG: acyl-CoA thioesterase [Planctomycetota bacterium]|nr:acyl-CoA thioesterase [Planctomycetota bacterium]